LPHASLSDNLYQGWIPAFVLSVYAYPTPHKNKRVKLGLSGAFVLLEFLRNGRVDSPSDERRLRRRVYHKLDTNAIDLTTIFTHLDIRELGYFGTFAHLNIVRVIPA
jgi:hypothetical protein